MPQTFSAGHVIGNQPANNLRECRDLCDAEANCLMASYKENVGDCIMKDGSDTFVSNADSTMYVKDCGEKQC